MRVKTHVIPIQKEEIQHFFRRPTNTAQWEKDESCTSKTRQKQANYVEINHFFNGVNLVPT